MVVAYIHVGIRPHCVRGWEAWSCPPSATALASHSLSLVAVNISSCSPLMLCHCEPMSQHKVLS